MSPWREPRDTGRPERVVCLAGRLDYPDMVGHDTALLAADNTRRLRRSGVTTRSTIDVLIATFCIVHGHSLLYSDRDFDPMCRHLGLTAA